MPVPAPPPPPGLLPPGLLGGDDAVHGAILVLRGVGEEAGAMGGAGPPVNRVEPMAVALAALDRIGDDETVVLLLMLMLLVIDTTDLTDLVGDAAAPLVGVAR